jgi:hypothetical protein
MSTKQKPSEIEVWLKEKEFNSLLELLDFPTATTIIYVEKRHIGRAGPRRTIVDYGVANQEEIKLRFWKRDLPEVSKVILRGNGRDSEKHDKTEEKTTRWVVIEYSSWHNEPTGYKKTFSTFEEAKQFYQKAKRRGYCYFGYPTEEE